jgi:hypothetical protein
VLLQRSLVTCLTAWRDAASAARADSLRAARHADGVLLHKVLPAWADVARADASARATAEAAIARRRRRALARDALRAWAEELACVREQRAGLWRALLTALTAERVDVLRAVLDDWHAAASERCARRMRITSFVNKRRLGCLADFLGLWQQYAAAMRTDGCLHASDGNGSGYSRWTLKSPRAAAMGSGACEDDDDALQQQLLPPGLLPVTGGPGSPLLAPRCARQDRHLARRLAAMGGAAPELDPGSDDEVQLFEGLPATVAATAAAARAERLSPLLALSRGYAGRRVTQGDDRTQYDDAGGEATRCRYGAVSPPLDLQAVADSVRVVRGPEQSMRTQQCTHLPACAPHLIMWLIDRDNDGSVISSHTICTCVICLNPNQKPKPKCHAGAATITISPPPLLPVASCCFLLPAAAICAADAPTGPATVAVTQCASLFTTTSTTARIIVTPRGGSTPAGAAVVPHHTPVLPEPPAAGAAGAVCIQAQ